MKKLLPASAVVLLLRAAAAQAPADAETQMFARVDEMLAKVTEITGLKVSRPVPRALITRDKIREYLEKRIAEAVTPEEIRGQELLLKKLGFVGPDFDLKAQTVDLLTEQAAAFYDFKQKKLYIATWTPSAMQDIALVHELAHAVADQHFNLEKFIQRANDDDDAAMARGAVVEGQATWVMTEYMARQMGQSLKTSPHLAQGPADAAAQAAKQFPVFGAAPLYMQETLLFPYTQGLQFQQALFQKLGVKAFDEVFRRPPASSQQVLHPEHYYQRTAPSKPALPEAPLGKDYKKLMEGTLGEIDHQILLRQYVGEAESRQLAPRWRGSRYALWENPRDRRAVLLYSVEWEAEADAAAFQAHYRNICRKKWKRLQLDTDEARQGTGIGDDGRFLWSLRGRIFTSVEGLPLN